MLKLFFNGFWSGFHDGTNAVNDKFFITLMKQVYNEDIIIGNLEDSDILIENTQITKSYRDYKSWKHTYLFSGESYIHPDKDKYSCVLYGQRSHNNIINCPLYLPYIYSSFDEKLIMENTVNNRSDIPSKDMLVIISNSGGYMRNSIIENFGKEFNITFAGHYKNNIGGALPYYYNSKEFLDYVSQFKYIISMENSEEEIYITEKIMHGMLAKTIPIYWGSKRVTNYFNNERFFEITDEASIDRTINSIKNMSNIDWLNKVNKPIFTNFGSSFNINKLAKYIKNLIFDKNYSLLTHTYALCNKDFEPERFNRLNKMFINEMNLTENNFTFISPSFKHLITDDMMKKHITYHFVQNVRRLPMKKAELSLFLNFKAVLEEINYMFRDGIFLLLESDAFCLSAIKDFNLCLDMLKNKDWSGINIGTGDSSGLQFCNADLPYRKIHDLDINLINQNSKEDLSCKDDTVRFIRKFHTRCTDSQLFSFKGCEKLLNYLNTETNYGAPFDYYLIQLLETHMDYKYYWSNISYFNQTSNSGIDRSTIQLDTC